MAASNLALAINAVSANANNLFNVTAFASGNRVTLVGDVASEVDSQPDNGVQRVRVEGTGGYAPILQGVDFSEITDGDDFSLTYRNTIYEFELDKGYTLETPVRYAIQVPPIGGRGVIDGDTFTISNLVTGQSRTFEMDLNGITTPGNHPIAYLATDRTDQLATKILVEVQKFAASGLLNLAPTVQTGGIVHLGTIDRTKVVVPADSRLTVLGEDDEGIADGDTFTISDGRGRTRVFEMTTDATLTDPVNNIPVFFRQSDTHDEIANAIANAIDQQALFAYPVRNLGNGIIHLGGDDGVPVGSFRHSVTSGTPHITPRGRPGLDNPAAVPAAILIDLTDTRETFDAAQVVTEMNNAIIRVLSRINPQFPIFTTQVVNDRLVVNADSPLMFTPGSSRILDVTRHGLGFALISNIEEAYDRWYNGGVALAATYNMPTDYRLNVAYPLGPNDARGRNMSDHIIATKIASVVGAQVEYRIGGVGGFIDRLTFPDAVTADFSGMNRLGAPEIWEQVSTSVHGVARGNIRIPLRADDWPVDHTVDVNFDGTPDGTQIGLANKIANAINQALDPLGIQATARGKYVRLNRGSITNSSSLIVKGEGPGGEVRGLATLNGVLYAVSDEGGLYRIDDPLDQSGEVGDVSTVYIRSSRDDLLGIRFSGLAAGPANVENGRYADMLFATDAAGTLYAFDTNGETQPVFVNGATSVSTGLHPSEVRGLAFSTLDENLFHRTGSLPASSYADAMDERIVAGVLEGQTIQVDERQLDPGHEGSDVGTSSLHFGRGNVNGTPRTYDFPGGAYGSIVSNEFSLEGYSAADRPVLYFSYYLDTENDSSDPNDPLAPNSAMMRDAFRVYVADNNGDWQLLVTNNSYTQAAVPPATVGNELLDLGKGHVPTEPDDKVQYFDVQEAFDVQPALGADDWRQVRVPLDQYAGRTNLRLRIDFSTAGDFNVGDVNTTGFELRAVAGLFIDDGETVQIGQRTLEFDSGLTIVAPTGAAIARMIGEEMTITDALDGTATLRFVDNLFTASEIIVTDGSQLRDGDVFYVSDGVSTQAFEYDSGYILHVPAAGGAAIADQETFLVDLDGDGENLPLAFEFDKDGELIDIDDVPGPDATPIHIADNLTILTPANGSLISDGEMMSLSNGITTYVFEFDKDGVRLSPRNLLINVANNRTILLPAAGGGVGGVRDGNTFRLDPDGFGRGVAAEVFEFDNNGVAGSGSNVIAFDHFTTQDQLADRVAAAIRARAGVLNLNAKNVGGGVVVLDKTTIYHAVDTSAAVNVSNSFQPPTQGELAERIIAALDAADGQSDGWVKFAPTDPVSLHLRLPNPADAEVQGGVILLDGTQPEHSLGTASASLGVNQTRTPRNAEDIASFIAEEINAQIKAQFPGSQLRAAVLEGGLVAILDAAGGVDHTVDVAAAPSVTLFGVPGVADGNLAVPFFPTDTLDEIVNGGPPVLVESQPPLEAGARPGLLQAISGSGLNVVASQRAFPDEHIVVLEGTAGLAATFAAGISPFQPRDVVPIFVSDTQTANDVAERIALGIRQAVARGDLAPMVAPHLNGNLGYENPSISPGDVRTNLVNVSGVKGITLSSGAASPIVIRGVYGLNDPNALDRALVTIDSDMDRLGVADSLDGVLESWLHNPTIITENGLHYHDEDSFVLEDGVNAAATYEFDSGYIVAVPIGGGVVADGGIEDGDYFTLKDSSGLVSATFEFDKDNSLIHLASEAVPISITDLDNALTVARAVAQAIQDHPLRSSLNMTPLVLTGNRVQIGGSRGSTLTISPGSTLTQSVRYVLEVPPSGGSAFRDGAAFSLTDGAATARFEFDKVSGLLPTPLGEVSWPVSISDADDREAVIEAVIAAVANHPLSSQLGLETRRLSGGRVAVFGGPGVTLSSQAYTFLTEPDGQPGVSPAVTLQLPETLSMQLPDPLMIYVPDGGIVDGEVFILGDGSLTRTFEFEDVAFANGVGFDQAIGMLNVPNIAIAFSNADGPEAIGRAILQAINQSSLFVSPTLLGGTGNIDLGGGADSALTLSSPTTLFPTGPLSLQTPADDPLGTPNRKTSGQKILENNTATTERFTIDTPTTTFVFEFDSDGVLGPTPSSTGKPLQHIRISFQRTDSQDQLADRILAVLQNVSGLGMTPVKSTGPVRVHLGAIAYDVNPATQVTLDTSRTHLSQTGRADVLADGYQFVITNGWSSLRDPSLPPLQLRVPAAGGSSGGVTDGEWFEIAVCQGDDVTHCQAAGTTGYVTRYVFELDSDGVISTSPSATETEEIKPIGISFLPEDSRDRVANRIRDAVDRVVAGMTPVNRFNGLVDLVVDAGVDSANYTLSFPVTVTFEFDLDGQVATGAAAVSVFSGSTPQQIAGEIVRQINQTSLGLNAQYLGDGKIHVGGTAAHRLDTASAPGLTQSGQGGPIPDGQAFYVTEGAETVRFEYDKDGVVTSGSIPIQLWSQKIQALPGNQYVEGQQLSFFDPAGGGWVTVTFDNVQTTTIPGPNPIAFDPVAPTPASVMAQRIFNALNNVFADPPDSTSRLTATLGNFNTVIVRAGAGDFDMLPRDDVAIATVDHLSPAVSGLFIYPAVLDNGLIDLGGTDENDVLTLTTSLEMAPLSAPLQLRVPALGGGAGGVVDQETFTLTNSETGTDYVFEFDNDGAVRAGNFRITFQTTSLTARRGDQYTEGEPLSFYDAGKLVTFTFDNVRTPQVPGPNPILFDPGDLTATPRQNPTSATEMAQRIAAAIRDASSLTVTANPQQPERLVVGGRDQNSIAIQVAQTVRNFVPGLQPVNLGDGVVTLGGDPAVFAVEFEPTVLVATGQRGGQTPRIPVRFSPSFDFTAHDVASAIVTSINGTLNLEIQASAGARGTADQRRVELGHTSGFPWEIQFQSNVGAALQLETPSDIVKQDEDLIRIIGHEVVDAGPLGFEDVLPDAANAPNPTAYLPGDAMGGFESATRGQRNQYEGVYLDDFIIGFAERGERTNNADPDTSSTFVPRPDGTGRTEGAYQLEIRRGADLTNETLPVSVDTNDRLATGVTLVVQRGLDIANRQTFRISDGVRHVDFEYLDTTIPNNAPTPGVIGIPFTPADPDDLIARRVRDAVNGPDVQAVLNVTASLSDGTLTGRGSPMYSTSNRVNLFGPVTLQIHATDVSETNDTFADATKTNILGIDSPAYLGRGMIGDNANFPLRPGFDVDLFEVALSAGETLRVDVDAHEIGAPLDAILRMFDRDGNELAISDNDAAPGEFLRLDPFLEYTPAVAGTYYIGVSGLDNRSYDPQIEGSGSEGNTGFYQIEITFGASTGSDFVLYDRQGDSNLFRDQGQILIHGNTITNSAGYGIDVAPGARDGQDGDIPHAGPVRNTPKLNAGNLVPGVVIANNIVAYNGDSATGQGGGIRFAGEVNPPGGQVGPVPFGRIVNNTIYGGVTPNATATPVEIVFMIATSPSLAQDIVELRRQVPGLDAQMRAANVDAQYGLVTFPDANSNSAPKQIQDLVPFSTFVAAGSPFNSFPVAGATEYGSQAVLEALNAFDPTTTFSFNRPGAQVITIMVTDEDDDSLTTDFTAALTALRSASARFFGITLDPDASFAGNTAQTYDQFARQTGGALFDINAFRQSPTTFFNAFSQKVVSTLAGGLGAGISVESNASPTILNNIAASLAVGISVDASSEAAGTVVGGTLYQGNQTDLNAAQIAEDFALHLAAADPLFRDATSGHFYLARLSPAIDSSVGSLLDRFDLQQVRNLLGIADSPILAPATDLTGQQRVDDPEVETPAGFGEFVFVDRGAVDRSDFVGPTATAVSPRDNDADGLDQNAAATALEFDTSASYSSFRIRLVDGVPPADAQHGSGLEDATVVSSNVILRRDGVPLVDGIDYAFSYNSTSDTIVLTPLSGIWEPNRVYTVELNNTDHFRVVAEPGTELLDGASFEILDKKGQVATFEIDSGYTLSVPQTLTLTVPSAGGSLGGIADGASFTVRRAIPGTPTQTKVFEFDSNGVWTDNNQDGTPDNILVKFTGTDTPDQISDAMVAALKSANIGLSPKSVGGGVVHMGSTAVHTVDVSRAPTLRRSGQSQGILDGEFFVVDDGSKIVTFEFDDNKQWGDADGDGNPDKWLIDFSASDTNVEIAEKIATQIELAQLGLAPVPLPDGRVHLGGTAYVHIVNVSNSSLALADGAVPGVPGQPGVRSAFGLRIPTRAGVLRLADDGSGMPWVQDRDMFTIGDGTRNVTFELDDLDARVGAGLTTAPNIVVAFHSSRWGLRIPTNADGSPRLAADASGLPYLADGQTFKLSDGTRQVTFEFDDTARSPGTALGNKAVPYSSGTSSTPASTTPEIAAAIVAAIRSTTLQGLNPVSPGGDIVLLGEPVAETSNYTADVSRTSLKTVGRPGLDPRSPDHLADQIVAAIRTAPLSGLKPVNAGLGVVLLGEPTDGTSRHALSATVPPPSPTVPARTPGLSVLGTAGTPAAVPVPVRMYTKYSNSERYLVNVSGAMRLLDAYGQPMSSPQPAPTVVQFQQPLTLALTVSDKLKLTDGATFTVTNDGRSAKFEYDLDGVYAIDAVPIAFTAADTVDEIAAATVQVVAQESETRVLGLWPRSLGSGRVHLGGDALVTSGSALSVAGQANPIKDGDLLTIDVPTRAGQVLSYTFEFENCQLKNGVIDGHIPVLFDDRTSQEGFVEAVLAAALNAGVEISMTAQGDGRLAFLLPELFLYDGTQVAVSLIQAIQSSSLAVTPLPAGGDVVLIQEALQVTEWNPVFVSNERRLGIKDRADNPLKANLLSGDTQMTIIVGNVNMDFGDSPQTESGHYPTELGLNGAVHVITDNQLTLGRRVDAERDGQVSSEGTANRDDNQDALDRTDFSVMIPPNVNVQLLSPTVMQFPQPQTLLVCGVQDGAIFTVTNNNQTATFEFDSNGVWWDADLNGVPDAAVIQFSGSDSFDQIGEKTASAVAAESDRLSLGLQPSNLGGGAVHLGGDGISIRPGYGLTEAGQANPIRDGDRFTIDVVSTSNGQVTRTATHTFEFEDRELDNGVARGSIPVVFDGSTTQEGFVRAVQSAVLSARLGIAATAQGNGQLELSTDDEEGVEIGKFNLNSVTEVVVTASAAGLLDAWIDFNSDGDFDDPGEQIFASQQLRAGPNAFEVVPAAELVEGWTIGRFRISSLGGLRPTGLAPDGEVEDHLVEIQAGVPPLAVNDTY
ncbi:MAG TPA: GEVED domain-containing protein, partial [Candidatus Anammoximicrobium sp.]|nr:GEVED domain-containing protein [Candidatus Anammoximicrobium sp.]